jgi:hypothetical protein
MTARSGDAMSHVNFRARQNIILIDLGVPNSRLRRRDDPPATTGHIRSRHNCMAAMRRHYGTNTASPHHLPFTCLNLSGSQDNCTHK